MKSYKQFKQELNEKVTASLSAAPSVSDGDFGSIRGLGLNTGDSITANLPGDKGRTKGKTDIRPDITRAIESGKKTGFIEEDENGKLSYKGVDGKLHNSPYAALEASTSFTKNVLVSSGVDGDLATKGSEAFSSLLKSGYISYDHKKGKVYVGDDEIDSFDTGSEKSMNNVTKTLPLKIFRSIYKSYLTPLQVEAKKAITRGNREASKKFQTTVTNINSLMKRIDGLSEDDVKTLMPFFVGNMINTQEMMNQSSDPPVIILPKGRRPVGDPIDPPGPGGPPKELDPKYFYPNGTPRIRPGAGNPQWGKPWATPETDRMRPQLRQGPDGPYWYTPPVAEQSSTAVKNFIKEVENTLVSLQTAKAEQVSQQQQQQQTGPTKLDPPAPTLRGVDNWWEENPDGPRPGARPEFEDEPGPEFPPTLILPNGKKIPWNHPEYERYRRLLGKRGLGFGFNPRPPYNPGDINWEEDNRRRLKRLKRIVENLPEELKKRIFLCYVNPLCNVEDMIRDDDSLRGLLWWLREYGPDLRDHPDYGDYWDDLLDLFPVLDETVSGVPQTAGMVSDTPDDSGDSSLDKLRDLIRDLGVVVDDADDILDILDFPEPERRTPPRWKSSPIKRKRWKPMWLSQQGR